MLPRDLRIPIPVPVEVRAHEDGFHFPLGIAIQFQVTFWDVEDVREISQAETEKSPELVNPSLGQFVRLLGPRRPRPVLVLWTFPVKDDRDSPRHSFASWHRPDQMMLAPRDVSDLLERELTDYPPRRFVRGDFNVVAKVGDIIKISSSDRAQAIGGRCNSQGAQSKL